MKKISRKVDIYEYIAKAITRYFEKRLGLTSNDLGRLYLGVMVILLNLFKMLLVCVTAAFFGVFKEVFLLIIMFGAVRFSAAGLHLRSNFMCTIACLVSYLGSVFIALNYTLNIKIASLISVFLIILLYKYSPADTENRPILREDHRKKLKIRTLKTAMFIFVINLLLKNTIIFNLTMYALLIQVICILPITYKILHIKYNNYEQYN